MAFNQENFSPVSNSSAAPGLWSYKTDDEMSAVFAPDYFYKKRHQLQKWDLIWCVCGDGSRQIAYMGDGLGSYVVAPKPEEIVLIGRDETTQEPSALDTPQLVRFGIAQSTPDADLAADGTLTIMRQGTYRVVGIFNVGRLASAGGVSHIYIRALKNGVQIGSPISTFVDNTNIIMPEEFELPIEVDIGDVFTVEIYRDNTGVNDGGLVTTTSSIGWGVAASATLRLYNLA